MAVILDTLEEEIGESWSETGLSKWAWPYLKNKLKPRDWWCGSSSSVCLSNIRP
jgi:hypothetical protein